MHECLRNLRLGFSKNITHDRFELPSESAISTKVFMRMLNKENKVFSMMWTVFPWGFPVDEHAHCVKFIKNTVPGIYHCLFLSSLLWYETLYFLLGEWKIIITADWLAETRPQEMRHFDILCFEIKGKYRIHVGELYLTEIPFEYGILGET